MNREVKSAVRVLDLLQLFAIVTESIGVSTVSRLMTIPKSSAQALLTTLVARGYLSRTAAGYEMNPIHKRQGWVGGSLSRLRKVAEPVMARIAAETGESVFLSVFTPNLEMKYIAKSISPNLVRYDAPFTYTRPAYSVSSGISLLAHLPEDELDQFFRRVRLESTTINTPTDEKTVRRLIKKARQQGYAALCDTHVDGASGVSAAILGETKKPIASLTLVGPTARIMASIPALSVTVVAAALELGHQISTSKRRSVA